VGPVFESERWRRFRPIAWVMFAFLFWRAVSIDLLMLRDSRYTVERWLAHGRAGSIGYAGLPEFLPRRGALPDVDLAQYWAEVRKLQPDLIVINAGFSRRAWENRRTVEFYRRLRSGEFGYTLAYSYQSPPGLSLLGHTALFRNPDENAFTNLDKVNPRIEVFRRTAEPVH
jgi:hypothetical protein